MNEKINILQAVSRAFRFIDFQSPMFRGQIPEFGEVTQLAILKYVSLEHSTSAKNGMVLPPFSPLRLNNLKFEDFLPSCYC